MIEDDTPFTEDEMAQAAALIDAIDDNDIHALKELLASSVSVNFLCENETPLMRGIKKGVSLDLVQLLIDAKVYLNEVDKHGNTALMMAVQREQMEVVKALIEAGAKIDIANGKGFTAKSMAGLIKREDMVILFTLAQSMENPKC